MRLHKVEGASDRVDAWWMWTDGHGHRHTAVSCKCSYVNSWGVPWRALETKGRLHCGGCGRTTEIELVS
jgi:hypothetical protein